MDRQTQAVRHTGVLVWGRLADRTNGGQVALFSSLLFFQEDLNGDYLLVCGRKLSFFFFNDSETCVSFKIQSSRKYDPGCSSRIRIMDPDPDFYLSRIQGSERHRISDPQH
jgi:hypothetical protein